MKLPNPDKLVVEREKIADYLLKPGASLRREQDAVLFRIRVSG